MRLRTRAALTITFLFTLAFAATVPAGADSLDLSAYKGKVVYLDFWASWCTPCRLSFPWMSDMQNAFARKGLVVIAVNVDHDRELADEFLQSNSGQFKIVYDPNGDIASKYGFKDMPTSFLIGRDGKVRFVHNGFFPDHEGAYYQDVSALLNEKAP